MAGQAWATWHWLRDFDSCSWTIDPEYTIEAPDLRKTMHTFFPRPLIERQAKLTGFQQRSRKLDVYSLTVATVLTTGSDDSGRQADIYAAYLDDVGQGDEVVRSSFYAWFDWGFGLMLLGLMHNAIEHIWAMKPLLTGELADLGVKDWIAVDSETVTLHDDLADTFPATSTAAGLKVHKYYSLGRNNVVDVEITPARVHDSPVLKLDERWRGCGLLVDLGYVSFDLIRNAAHLDIGLIIRLKKGWKPRLLRSVDEFGQLISIDGEPVLEDLLDMDVEDYDGSTLDFDVVFGTGDDRVEARLVGVPGPQHYHWCITLLPREVARAELVCDLYRTRWEIELDNRRDKGGARLDQIRARKPQSVLALVYGSLLRTMLCNHLVYMDLRDRPKDRAPLHGLAVALALNTYWERITMTLDTDDDASWGKLARNIRRRGHDPNWRHRPSVLDRLRGVTATRARRSRRRASP